MFEHLLADVQPQFESNANGDKVLLLDADFLIYRAAATVKTLPTAIRRFYQMVLTQMFLTGTKECRIFITPSNCAKCNRYFYPTIKVYQDQRKANKVELPLKAPLKQHLLTNPAEYIEQGIAVAASDWFEADDLMIIHAYELKESGIISSGDKDLRLTPYPWWDNERGQLVTIPDKFGHLYWDADAPSNARCKGHGTKFFWAQMLMGDTADNVKGIEKFDGQLCGPAKAFQLLDPIKNESDAANFVCRAYARRNQNVLAEAEMMWLRRTEDDSAYAYLMEVVTDDAILGWLMQLHEFHTTHLEWVQEQATNGDNQELEN
ncbi:putative DNA exonuclease [Erwinia phage Micant]|uniref:DNA exonuclease n=1 Tax=Erwinia phage Micant TaxID=2923255 RepID=A0AAE9FS83_9CAUD|nr:putative DNA exonuclease [Erwinia phage Micant]